jgi:hypothetical protein
MENHNQELDWYPVFFYGNETNLHITRAGQIKRVRKIWNKHKLSKYGHVDFADLSLDSKGHRIIGLLYYDNGKVHKQTVKVHTLVAMTFMGHQFITKDRSKVIIHKDGNKLNYHILNLELVSFRKSIKKTRKVELPLGVNLVAGTGKYIARIWHNQRTVYLGQFLTPEEASNAYQKYYSENNI